MAMTDAQMKRELTGYRYADQTTRHIQAVVKNFQSLQAGKKEYVHSNGAREQMMCLSGTIPVHIQGASYNIPVGLYLRTDYPYHCPYCLVQPTPDMMIAPSKYVNQQGVIFLPYLHDWKANQCDLTTLIQVLIAAFSEKSPVFARPPNQPPPPPQQQQQQYRPAYGAGPYPNQGYPPYTQGGSNPPYPVTTGQSQMPTPHMPSAQAYSPASYQPAGGYPPTQSLGGVATAAAVAGTAAAVAVSAEDKRKKEEEQEKAERESLISAVTDRIKRQVRSALDQGEVEMSQLIETQEKLKRGSEDLNRKLQNMEDEQRKVECAIEEMRLKTAEIESVVDQLEQQPEVDVDEAVVGANVVFNQILHLYAEENAIDDTIYYLSEALRKEVITLDVFLKHVREISREQFLKRALIAKARATAGLPERR